MLVFSRKIFRFFSNSLRKKILGPKSLRSAWHALEGDRGNVNVSAPEFPPKSSFPGESLPRKRKPVGSKEFKHVDNNNETRQPVVTGRTREIQLPTLMARVTTYAAQRRERKRGTAQFFADAFSPDPFGQHVLLSQSPEVFLKIFTTLNAEAARFVCAMIRSRSLLSVA